jgi:hypothetical protein
MNWSWLQWAAVAALGGVVGASELMSRYKDDPGAALRTWPAIFYIAMNSAASVGALALIRTIHWDDNQPWVQDLTAGIGAIAFFRSSIFTVRAGDKDIGIGPSGFLQIYLSAADRAVDRDRAAARSAAVAKVMDGVDFDKAKAALPPYCIGLMQNVSQDEQQALAQAVGDLDKGSAEPNVKSLLLGIELMNVVGLDVLTGAVKSLADQIRPTPKALAAAASSRA